MSEGSTHRRMKSDIGPYSIIPEWLIGRVSPSALTLFALLGRYANRDDEAWPSYATLAKRLGTSRRSVINWMQELENVGAVEIQSRRDETGDHGTNIYSLRYANPSPQVVNDGSLGVVNEDSPGVVNGGSPKREPVLTRTNVKNINVQKRFRKPSPNDVRRYAETELMKSIDHVRFWDYYEACGWKVGSKPMKDWKAAVRNWIRRSER